MPSTGLGHGDSAARLRRPPQQSQDGYFNEIGSGGGETREAGKGRRAIPVAVDDAKTLLSPLMGGFPALPNLSSLRTFLPTSSPPASSPQPQASVSSTTPTFHKWQCANLGDGRGRQILLLVCTADCALRVFRMSPSTIPEDPQVMEDVPAPEEVLSLAQIKRDDSTRLTKLSGVNQGRGEGREAVMCAQIVDEGGLLDEYGPVAVLISSVSTGKAQQADFALIVVALRTGLAVREVGLGRGRAASMQCSSRTIAVATADPPIVHLLHPSTLEPFHILSGLPTGSNPNFALSGRLLAFVTDESPRSTGSAGLGTLISAHSIPRSRVVSEGAERPLSPGTSTSSIVSSAVSIGGDVARGVWAGLKMGAQAAHQVNAARLARSAPANGSILGLEDETLTESRSMEDFPAEGIGRAGWIKIIDLGRLPSTEVTSPYESPSRQAIVTARPIAHFRLPIAKSDHRPQNAASNRSVAFLSWNTDGTRLLAAPSDGRAFHIFQIHPSGPGRAGGDVLHLYELKRGTTAASVQEVVWDESGRWVGIATERGTIHVYPIHPSGAPATSATHTISKITNPTQLHPLSQIVEASARIWNVTSESSQSGLAVSFTLGRWQRHPLEGSYCQDICIFRPSLQVIELQRLSVRPARGTPAKGSMLSKRGSGITEMMRQKGSGGLATEQSVRARWRLSGVEGDLDIESGVNPSSIVLPPLANAEIRTYSVDPRILPASIYRSHQVEFFSARPVDEASPQSIMDPTSRLHRLTYRSEVQVKPSTTSFDETLSTALHTRIESPTRGEIPGLPNGSPSTKWRSPIPIRTVAAGVGEGLDRVRQTYVKGQVIRRHRRASEHEANRLSFEEGAIFASSPNGLGLDLDDSSPASESIPISESAVDDEEWSEGWDDADTRTAEIEEEPDDLVLGLMDEEEDERRRVLAKARVAAEGKKGEGERKSR